MMKKTKRDLFLSDHNLNHSAQDFINKTAIGMHKVFNKLCDSIVHYYKIVVSDVNFLEHTKLLLGGKPEPLFKAILSSMTKEQEFDDS